MPLPFCVQVRAPRLSASFQVGRVHVPRSSHDQDYWVRVQPMIARVGGAALSGGLLNIHDPRVDTYISGSLQRTGMWEANIVSAMRQLLAGGACDKNALVVDVGANIGYFSFVAALSGCRVVSFEPTVYNTRQVERTMNRNHLPHWTLYRNAVSDVTGDQVFLQTTDAHVNAGNHKIGRTGDHSAYTVRLDDIIHEDVAFLKVDVEGYEAFVLSGAAELFCVHTVRAVVLEMTHDLRNSGCDVTKMLRWMYAIGYEMRHLQNVDRVIPTQQGDSNALFVLKDNKRRVDTQRCMELSFT
jgi:FkbM family methyltransferase